MDLVDTHCHPYFDNIPDKPAMVEAARQAGVNRMIAVGTTLGDSLAAIDFASKYDNVWATAGVHPHEATTFNEDKTSSNRLRKLLNKSRIVAIGEIGLDYFKNYASRDDQLKALRSQLDVTVELDLPYVFHIRDAWADFWEVFDNYPGIRGVVHSFTATTKELDQALRRGLYIGLNGIMTFTKDDEQLAAARAVPDESLLLETDAPFLAPRPFRGTVCEPKHVAVTAEFLAELRGQELAALAHYTTVNAEKVFGLKS